MPLGTDRFQQGPPLARPWVPPGHALLNPAEMIGDARGVSCGSRETYAGLQRTTLIQIRSIFEGKQMVQLP